MSSVVLQNGAAEVFVVSFRDVALDYFNLFEQVFAVNFGVQILLAVNESADVAGEFLRLANEAELLNVQRRDRSLAVLLNVFEMQKLNLVRFHSHYDGLVKHSRVVIVVKQLLEPHEALPFAVLTVVVQIVVVKVGVHGLTFLGIYLFVQVLYCFIN